MINQILYLQGDTIPPIPNALRTAFPHIVTDPEIHSGWPTIKGSRILAIDIFRAHVNGHSYASLVMDFKEIGVAVSEKELDEAFRFTLEWLRTTTHGKASQKTSK